jgi:hypothetical protein
MLGPHVIKALEGRHMLRLTDINDTETAHEYFKVDVSDLDRVVAAADGMDAIINCSVLRQDRKLAFDVNARGCYNMMTAAVRHGIRRIINTGPMFTVAGPTYERFDHRIGPDIPPQPGTYIYAHTKSLGQEICRVFTENHDIYVMGLLFYMFIDAVEHTPFPGGPPQPIGEDFTPYTVTWSDAATAFTCALDIELDTLPSRCEQFFVSADLPHGKWSNEKTKRILQWQPKDRLEEFWHKI